MSEDTADGHRRRSIHVGGFAHKNPVPAASRIGPLIISGAITGRDPETKLMPTDLDTQCVNAFRHVRSIIEAAGGTTNDIARLTVRLSSFRDRAALNREWEALFPDPDDRPARQVISAVFDGDMQIQCEFIALAAEDGDG